MPAPNATTCLPPLRKSFRAPPSSRSAAKPAVLKPSVSNTMRSIFGSFFAAAIALSKSRNWNSRALSPVACANARCSGALVYCSTRLPSRSSTSAVFSCNGPTPAPDDTPSDTTIRKNSRNSTTPMKKIMWLVKRMNCQMPVRKLQTGLLRDSPM